MKKYTYCRISEQHINRARDTYVIHVPVEVAAHGVLDERTNHQRAVRVVDGTCRQTQLEYLITLRSYYGRSHQLNVL